MPQPDEACGVSTGFPALGVLGSNLAGLKL